MSLDEELSFIPTKGSISKKNSESQFKSVVYESHKPKVKIVEKKTTGSTKRQLESETAETNTLNIKKARHEIIKFGMSGFDQQNKEDAKVQLAIKLGAKPPKNKYKNYKLLLEEKAKEREQAKLLNIQQLDKNNIGLGKFSAKGKKFNHKRRKERGILDVYNQNNKTVINKRS